MNNNYNHPVNLPPKESGLCVAALVLGIVGFFINPLYLVSTAAVVLGIVGICTAGNSPKGKAVTGIILGIVAFILQLVCDILLSIFTFGFSFCI